ncbi:MAG: hypothetical protein AAF467_01385 [Actinomycetota bacterium]
MIIGDDVVTDAGDPVRVSLCWFGDTSLHELTGLYLLPFGFESAYGELLIFRDDELGWWRPDPGGGWQHFGPTGWSDAPRPHRLEGRYPCVLPVLPITMAPSTAASAETVGPDQVGPVEALERSVQMCREFYRAGRLPMWDAEAALTRCLLVTDDGLIRSPGALSGEWYVWRGAAWVVDQRPLDAAVQGLDDGVDGLGPEAAGLVDAGPLTPEPITPDWNPPSPPAPPSPPTSTSAEPASNWWE